MGGTGVGCCCGMVAGGLIVLLLAAAAGFGIYVWFNPEAREAGLVRVESGWTQVKVGVDNQLEQVRKESETEPKEQ